MQKPASVALAPDVPPDTTDSFRMRWVDNIPFLGVHVTAVVGVAMLGFSWSGVALALAFYVVRMFGITAGYHRYFAHRTFKTSRPMQFLLALLGVSSVQKGPLWWASHHRRHHKYSDMPEDVHSVKQRGFAWGHWNWIMVRRHAKTELERIHDFARYPELRFLNRFHAIFDVGTPTLLFFVGGFETMLWGYFVSTVFLWHGTFTINSLAHVWGRKRYTTGDESRNNGFLALITLGEGWHNNHHYYQRSVRQGFYWWELDITFYALKVMSWFGLVWDLQGVPRHVRDQVAAPQRLRVVGVASPMVEVTTPDADLAA